MSECRQIATCPTSSSNGVNETRTTRRGNKMRERAEGRDDNETDSPRRQTRRGAESRAGRDDAGKELSPTCLLANLLTCQLAHHTYYAFSRSSRPVLIVSSSRRAIREAGRFSHQTVSSSRLVRKGRIPYDLRRFPKLILSTVSPCRPVPHLVGCIAGRHPIRRSIHHGEHGDKIREHGARFSI